MERFISPREQPEDVVVLELVQANGALQRPLPDLQPLHGRVLESGKALDDGHVDPMGSPTERPPAGEERPLQLDRRPAPGPPLGALPYVDGDKAHEEEGADQEHHDYGHQGVELLAVWIQGRQIRLPRGGGVVLRSCSEQEEEEDEEEEENRNPFAAGGDMIERRKMIAHADTQEILLPIWVELLQ